MFPRDAERVRDSNAPVQRSPPKLQGRSRLGLESSEGPVPCSLRSLPHPCPTEASLPCWPLSSHEDPGQFGFRTPHCSRTTPSSSRTATALFSHQRLNHIFGEMQFGLNGTHLNFLVTNRGSLRHWLRVHTDDWGSHQWPRVNLKDHFSFSAQVSLSGSHPRPLAEMQLNLFNLKMRTGGFNTGRCKG